MHSQIQISISLQSNLETINNKHHYLYIVIPASEYSYIYAILYYLQEIRANTTRARQNLYHAPRHTPPIPIACICTPRFLCIVDPLLSTCVAWGLSLASNRVE